MKTTNIDIILSKTGFKNFAIFDMAYKHKRWKFPVIAAAIFFIAASFMFAIQDTVENAFLVGTIFVIVALGIGAGYFRNFFRSIPKEAEKMQIHPPRHVYSINLVKDSQNILFYLPKDKKPSEQFSWKSINSAYRTSKAIYIYVTPERALLIPGTTKDLDLDEVWSFLGKKLPDEKLHLVNKFFIS